MNQFENVVHELNVRCRSIRINQSTPSGKDAPSADALKIQMEMVGKELPGIGAKITETLDEILKERGITFEDDAARNSYVERVKPTITQIATRIIQRSI